MKLNGKKNFGKLGENIAAEYLKRKGYSIIARNFYCKMGEIDIIAKEKHEIVFVEVKTRNGERIWIPIRSYKLK